jgi:hypothetical protein
MSDSALTAPLLTEMDLSNAITRKPVVALADQLSSVETRCNIMMVSSSMKKKRPLEDTFLAEEARVLTSMVELPKTFRGEPLPPALDECLSKMGEIKRQKEAQLDALNAELDELMEARAVLERLSKSARTAYSCLGKE